MNLRNDKITECEKIEYFFLFDNDNESEVSS